MSFQGLTQKQAEKRLKKFGLNEIPEKETTAWQRFFKKLWSPIPWMIEVAALISAFLGKWEEFVIIITLLAVNVIVDYLQESKALHALAVLKNKLARRALVLRDGRFQEIDARYLVSGDIIKLKIGDIIPADACLVEGKYLEVDQSALTGESLPVEKHVGEEVYSSTIVKAGEMLAQVTHTGVSTFFGRSVALVKKAEEEEKSHFQKAIIKIGDFLILFSTFLAAIILVFAFFRHDSLLEDLQFVLILLVASIPVALPAVLSVTMAVGAISIARRKAIVRNLPAIEELAGIDILCSDKTGTLTQNKMEVKDPLVYSPFSQEDLFVYAALASKKENKDPIEEPIFEYLEKKFSPQKLSFYKIIDFTPFNPNIKKSEAVVQKGRSKITIVKGAPQVVALLCPHQEERILRAVSHLARRGYRTLAVAVKKGRKSFQCVGLIPLFDPPREDSQEVVEDIKKKGIEIKMLTGDNQAIAQEIAQILRIGSNILDASYFREKASKQKYHESEIIELIKKADGFSQVLPEDKYFIIDKLQKGGHIVAMNGDGVNDAPALKKADVGIAVSRATDAARAAADLILLAPGLRVIDYAIEIARQTFERMKGYATFRIAETIRIILFMFLSIVIFNFYPVTAVMIIMLALLNDIPIMMVAYDNASANTRPVRWDMREVLTIASVLGVTGVLSSFLLFYWLKVHNFPLAIIQTMLFAKLDIAGHSTLYLTRTGRYHFWHKPYPSLKFFLPAFGSRIIGILIAAFGIFVEPISWKAIGYLWIYATVWWLFNDFLKVWVYKILDKYRETKLSYLENKAHS